MKSNRPRHPSSVLRPLSFVLAFAVVALAASANADRTVSIASTSSSAATLAFGPADGVTYTLYMAYGTTDGGTTLSGWDDTEEIGEIDPGDNDYECALPTGWGSSVKALRFFLLRSDDSVAAYTDALISSNDLIVEAGHSVTLSASAQYDAVRLRDTLLLTGGTLRTPTVVVDGPNGCVDINGGTLSENSRLSLDPALSTANEYATVLVLRQGTATTLHCATNANANVAARIHFLGGSLRCTSFSGKPLCSANGGKWILEGTWGCPIRFGDLGLQRMDWLTGDGSIETLNSSSQQLTVTASAEGEYVAEARDQYGNTARAQFYMYII